MLHRKTMSSAPVQRRMAAQRTSFAQGPNPSRSMSRASRGVHVSAALLDVAQLKVSLKSVSARLPSMVATALRRAVDPKVGHGTASAHARPSRPAGSPGCRSWL